MGLGVAGHGIAPDWAGALVADVEFIGGLILAPLDGRGVLEGPSAGGGSFSIGGAGRAGFPKGVGKSAGVGCAPGGGTPSGTFAPGPPGPIWEYSPQLT